MSDNLPPLKPDLEGHEYELWGQNMRGDFVTVEKAKAYARAALEASRAAVPAGMVADLGFRWDGEKQHHVPRLVIEFEPVPANSPCDAKGWTDRDRAAKLFSAAHQPVAQPGERCPNCDDTGDVHSIDGQWRGSCPCPAAPVTQAKPEQAAQPFLTCTCFNETDRMYCTSKGKCSRIVAAAAPPPKD